MFNYKAELIVSSYQVVLQELKMKMISLPTDCIKCSVRKVGERWKEMVACLNTAVEIYACCSALGEKKKGGWASSKGWKVLLSQLISKKDYKVSFK